MQQEKLIFVWPHGYEVFMNVLLLGGTADARRLSDQLTSLGVGVIYSLAGLVRTPIMNCQILVGGFTQFGGLTQYLTDQKQVGKTINMILDATHPYAQIMSDQAIISAKALSIPCWRFYRPAWQQQKEDIWTSYKDYPDLYALLATKFQDKNVLFLTAGQFSKEELSQLITLPFEKIILRTAVKPNFSTDTLDFSKITWLKAIGPFSYEAEEALIEEYGVDLIVSKNSGGKSTYAKIVVAQKRAIPVLMLVRPTLLPAEQEFTDLDTCIDAVVASEIIKTEGKPSF